MSSIRGFRRNDHRFLSSSEVWSMVGGHQVRGRRRTVRPSGGSAEGGGRKTSRDGFSRHQGQRASSWYRPWRTSCPASLLCTPSLLPLKERERQSIWRSRKKKKLFIFCIPQTITCDLELKHTKAWTLLVESSVQSISCCVVNVASESIQTPLLFAYFIVWKMSF